MEYRYKKVMIIDDNDIDLFVNENLFKITYFAQEVATFNEASEAVKYLRAAASEDIPEFIFLDISMPEMNGLEFLEKVQKIIEDKGNPSCEVVLLTSSINPDEIKKGMASNLVTRYFGKPLRKQDILDMKEA